MTEDLLKGSMLSQWKFEPTVNLGHVLTIIALLGGGISIYVGVFQTLTTLVLRVDVLEKATIPLVAARDTMVQDHSDIADLKSIANGIQVSNAAMLEQLTGIRVDVGVLKARSTVEGIVKAIP